MKQLFFIIFLFTCLNDGIAQKRARDYGIEIGVLKPGTNNAITDVKGVLVGHVTLMEGENIRTGVTAIVPHDKNIFQNKVPAAIYVGNGFGKLAGSTQVEELGNIETPIVLTNTLSVAQGLEGLIDYTLSFKENENVKSVNGMVGETNDGGLNDIQGRHVKKEHVVSAIKNAKGGKVEEGSVGAGTGTICFGFKGGIGTSSRVLPKELGGYTVGVLTQTNFGGVLQIDGVPVGEELGQYAYKKSIEGSVDGSCMMVVATDAPLDARNLKRLAKRAIMGLAKTGGIASNGSGDYVIVFSANESVRIPFDADKATDTFTLLRNDNMSPLFMATIEATEEAIINSLFAAKSVGKLENEEEVKPLPIDKVIKMMKKYNRIR
ncbi:MAG: P1 family peptidase [Cyclobacteriaceae bacterium]|nr:P1 family peptidase [Cyclobacteriaceae bacterium]